MNEAATLRSIVVDNVLPTIDSFIGFVMVLAVLFFVIGIVRFIATAGDERARDSGKRMMVWGTVALFFMVATWGIVKIIKVTFFG